MKAYQSTIKEKEMIKYNNISIIILRLGFKRANDAVCRLLILNGQDDLF